MTGRVEAGLNDELRGNKRIGKAERSSLRDQARAVDMASSLADPHLVSEANRVYLDLRQAAGLTAGVTEGDTFGQLLAELSRPSPALGHPEKP